jgi:hypothetical protein
MARIKQEDLDRVKDLAISRHLALPAGAKLKFERQPIKERDLVAVAYIDAVLTLLNSKGFLKEDVTIEFDLDTTESVWSE